MSTPTITPITLNRAQREALRDEIRVAAGDLRDLGIALDSGDRAFAAERIALLQQLAAALDLIGWTEPEDAPDDLELVVDRHLALWARGQFLALSRSLSESTPYDMDGALTALGALHLLAEDLIADTDWETAMHRWAGMRDLDAALGIALDCLADEATIEQLTAARAAAEELGSVEASAQLGHLIDARGGGEH